MALKPESILALDKAEDYAVRVINELAKPEAKLEQWRTMEIDEAIDILDGICDCKYKDACAKGTKSGEHSYPQIMSRSASGHYGR